MRYFSGVEIQVKRGLYRRLSLSEHLPILLHLLLGRAPIRRLAKSLITILLLISPLSFSTDKIRNFTYECPVSVYCSLKETRKVAVYHCFAKHALVTCALPDVRFASPSRSHPPVVTTCSTTHSRAPPA